MISLLGIFVFLLFSWVLSSHKKSISWKLIINALLLQLVLAVLVLGIPKLGIPGLLEPLFQYINIFFVKILEFTDEGTKFLFGPLLDTTKMGGLVIALKILPTIIFFSALMAAAYYLGIIQKIIHSISWITQKILGTSPAETLSASANIFVGQTEAPLIIRPYLNSMTSSELLSVMTAGMATVAGGVMAAYVSLLEGINPNIAGHLLSASVMSVPAALLVSKLILPETQKTETTSKEKISIKTEDANLLEALTRGTLEGLQLAFNVGAMLLVFIALIAMSNYVLLEFGQLINFDHWGKNLTPSVLLNDNQAELSLELIFSWIFYPVAWLMGIPKEDCALAAVMLGQKISLNEFVAYLSLSQYGKQLSDSSFIIMSYALCGFANFSSIAIQIGGIGSLAPKRRSEIAALGIRAMIGGSLAAFLTACVVALFI